ncbi:MAG: LL-diaminopimelate aminotransferase [Oscillospiraceae bacterium]|nr:LL-diaminopimelate aminotransferase [Oscillospiraceae bacterium]
MKLNNNYQNLKKDYLFSTINKKVEEYKKTNPNADIIKLGIGDVTKPLCPEIVEAMTKAAQEMGKSSTFRGYGPEQGYLFLRESIAKYYSDFEVSIKEDEIFVSDGAKSDLGNILDLFSGDNTVLIPDPVYPAYVDTNIMDGRKIIYIGANESNKFLPLPDDRIKSDIIYICSPNNPTGAAYDKEGLKKWVNYAINNDAIIFYDSAYEAFIDGYNLPHSIYQIEGAKECAIEFCSLSKRAGFTGTRCGYTVIPKKLKRNNVSINELWFRRQSTKFNGVSYIVQRGAQAAFSIEGSKQINENIFYYRENAKIISDGIKFAGFWFIGGKHSPYIWFKCPNKMSSWEMFDYLLEKANVVGTPGCGFGKNGEGFFRITSFGSKDKIFEAMARIKKLFI